MDTKTKNFLKVIATIVFVGIVTMIFALCVPSCNVTRIITNESSYLQRGDTNVVIHTKTIETYDASKKGL